MAAVPSTSLNAVSGSFTPTKILLATSGDTLTYTANTKQQLVLHNSSVSDVVCTIDGSTGTTVVVPGAGGATFSVASGLAITVTAGQFAVVMLDTIPAYLKGNIAISAATGAVVSAAILY